MFIHRYGKYAVAYHIAMFMFTFCSLICNSFTFPSTCHPYIPFILLYWRAGASQPSRSTGTIFHYYYLFIKDFVLSVWEEGRLG